MMDLETEAKESLFCVSLPNLPRAWDSTMLGLLKECPRKFQYVILYGHQPQGFAAHLEFGAAYHSALEQYDHWKADGADHHEATREALRFCLSYGDRAPDGSFRAYDWVFTHEANKTRNTLVRTVGWYLEEFGNDDPASTVMLASGRPAVELSFKLNLDLDTPDGEPFILAGHLDRVVEFSGGLYFLDRKTTKSALDERYFRQFTPNNQMSLYYAAGQMILKEPIKGGIIDAAQIGVTFSRFRRHTLHRTPGQQAEWHEDTAFWITQAMEFASRDYWPMNDKSCSNFGGCAFQPICARDPKVRDAFLTHQGYIKRTWNPLESR